ncbi:MAG: hypothetical protein IPH10_02300 [bacterium]|nr:hypothetical protein [bacterium]
MESHNESNLLETLERYRVRRFTGKISVENELTTADIWFVRGNLTHVENRNGETGWKALEGLKGGTLSCAELMDALPPQRSIRVETGRLLKAMRSSAGAQREAALRVPVPLHLRLQTKFMELRNRISGLRAFELSRAKHERESSRGSGERLILERDPRGCRWTHRNSQNELTVRGDESTTTTELMLAGEEMWREFERLNHSDRGHE